MLETSIITGVKWFHAVQNVIKRFSPFSFSFLEPKWNQNYNASKWFQSEVAMPSANLTDRKIASLKPAKVLVECWDKKTPGFGIRVSPEGRKTWFVMYRLAGVRRRMRLGHYPEVTLEKARKKATEALSDVSEGKDPAQEKRARVIELKRDRLEAKTFEQLAGQYLEQYAKKQKKEKTWKEYGRIIEKILNPAFGKLDTKEVEQSHLRSFLRNLAATRPVLANRTRAVIGAIYKWAIKEDIVAENPVSGISRPGGQETPKERTLSDDELKTVWNGLEKETSQVKVVLRLILLTGQRPGEVMGMRWDEIDSGEGLWEIPGSRTKNRKPHVVPLSAQALRILEKQRETLTAQRQKREDRGDPTPEGPFVFPNRFLARQAESPVQMLRKTVNRVCQELNIKSFAPHDLRRTCATYLGKMEVPGFVIALILNHTLPGVTNRVYNRYDYLKEKREALTAWGSRLSRIVSGLELIKADNGEGK
jgi:integrase